MQYDNNALGVRLSVRELAAAATKSGGLASSFRENVTAEDGREAHRRLASLEGEGFQSEVSVSATFESGGVRYIISGRADGVLTEKDGTLTVVEYKTVTHSAFDRAHKSAYTAQLMIYAALLCIERDLTEIVTRLTISVADLSRTRNVERKRTREELELALHAFIAKISQKAQNEVLAVRDVHPRLAKLKFPHPSLREGQRQLIGAVRAAVKGGQRLFVQAPTGIGKTVSVLYGAVRAMGESDVRRLFYLTAKASTRREAYAACGKLASVGANLKVIVLNAKEQMCPRRQAGMPFICDSESCQLAKGYYERCGDAIGELIRTYHGYPTGAILKMAEKYSICPYELSLDLSEYCDIIICDYNYAFDPSVKLRRYFSDEARGVGENVFLIDEAHNLPERARDIYSATISRRDIAAVRAYTALDTPTDRALVLLDDALVRAGELCEENMSVIEGADGASRRGYYFNRESLPVVDSAFEAVYEKIELFFVTHKTDTEAAGAVASFLRLSRKWRDANEAFDEKYRTYIERVDDEVTVKLYCLDPSTRLDEALGRARSAVFFSATLTPAEYFSALLGGGRGYKSITLPSPFPRERLCVATLSSVSTRYEDRAKSYKKIVAAIAATVSAKRGNYIVYFPSYSYLSEVTRVFTERFPTVSVNIQRPSMTREEREDFISYFKEDEGRLRIGFSVLGGSFSEGVDLPGSRLIGSIIVGVGLPGLSAERNIIRDYFENTAECGYDFAYTYPGMNSVLQAAGRVIRREGDRGVVVLIDDRYESEKYKAMFPSHWGGMKYCPDVPSLSAILSDFWSEKE